MAAPRQSLNPATTSVGLSVKLVTVQSVTPDGKTAVCTDRQNTQVSVPMLVQRSKGLLPAVGDTWLVSQDLGQWTFCAFVASSPAQFQTVAQSSGVYTQATAPGTPTVGELWVNTGLSNMMTVWDGTEWIPVQFGAVAIQPGSLTGAQLSEEAGIVASQVNFTADDIGGVTTTISATAPTSPSFGDLWYDAANGYQLNQWSGTAWVPYQFGTQAISARSVTTELLAAEAVTAHEMAAGIIYGGIIDGTVVDAATFIGSTFEGTDFILNGAGGFWYSSTPGLGNLFVNITSQPGVDGEGNSYSAGVFLFGPNGSFVAMEDSGPSATIVLNPAGATQLTVSPQAFGNTSNQGAADENTWLVLTSGKESGNDDAALQLRSESADGTISAQAIIEFGGTVFASITKMGLVLPGLSTTPPFVSGQVTVYGTSNGDLQVMDGLDGEPYGTQRRSIGINSTSTISGTSPATVLSSALGGRSYRISGMLILTPNQSAGAMGFTWQTSTSTGLMSILTTASTSTLAGTSTWSRDGIGSGTTVNLGPTMTTGEVYSVRFDGYIQGSGGDTLQIQLNCGSGGDTFNIHTSSYVDIMPV